MYINSEPLLRGSECRDEGAMEQDKDATRDILSRRWIERGRFSVPLTPPYLARLTGARISSLHRANKTWDTRERINYSDVSFPLFPSRTPASNSFVSAVILNKHANEINQNPVRRKRAPTNRAC